MHMITLSLCILLLCVGAGEAPLMGGHVSTRCDIGNSMHSQSIALIPSESILVKVLSFDLDLHHNRIFENTLHKLAFEETPVAVFSESRRLASVGPLGSVWPQGVQEGHFLLGDRGIERLSDDSFGKLSDDALEMLILGESDFPLLPEVWITLILCSLYFSVNYQRVPDKKVIWRSRHHCFELYPERYKDFPELYQYYVELFQNRRV